MGQAKNRGTLDDRKSDPRKPNFDKMTHAEIKKFFEVPENAIFKGYVIHSEQRDDFLAKITEDRNTIRRSYCQSPDDALKFDSYRQAEKISKKVPPNCKIGVLFDYDNILNVGFLELA